MSRYINAVVILFIASVFSLAFTSDGGSDLIPLQLHEDSHRNPLRIDQAGRLIEFRIDAAITLDDDCEVIQTAMKSVCLFDPSAPNCLFLLQLWEQLCGDDSPGVMQDGLFPDRAAACRSKNTEIFEVSGDRKLYNTIERRIRALELN